MRNAYSATIEFLPGQKAAIVALFDSAGEWSGNALNLEVGAPVPRCRLKPPEHWGSDTMAPRWLLSGGSPLVFGPCSKACPREAGHHQRHVAPPPPARATGHEARSRVMATEKAKAFAAKFPEWSPKVWARAGKVRVYLTYPRTATSAGGGDAAAFREALKEA